MKPAKTNVMENQVNWVLDVLRGSVYVKSCDLNAEYAATDEPVPYDRRLQLSYKPIAVGEKWSCKPFECAWFHITGMSDGNPDNVIALDFDGEACVYDAEGTPCAD